MRRTLSAVGLFFLAPLVAEFLLGNLPITLLSSLIVLAPMYGGGALLVREVVRRTGRGWSSIFVLGLAFGIAEEAFMTQSLFNPDYLGLHAHLLQPAYIPALGIGAWWTVFVLTLHTVWSISVSIALMESMVPERANKPWLGGVGLGLVTLLFVLASIAIAKYTVQHDATHFMASRIQFASSAVVLVVLVTVSFFMPKRGTSKSVGEAPSPWLVGAIALSASSLFIIFPVKWGWWAVAVYLLLYVAMTLNVTSWARRSGWDSRHRLALAAGAAMTYAWHAFVQPPSAGGGGTTARIGNVVFAIAAVAVIGVAAKKTTAYSRQRAASADVVSAD